MLRPQLLLFSVVHLFLALRQGWLVTHTGQAGLKLVTILLPQTPKCTLLASLSLIRISITG